MKGPALRGSGNISSVAVVGAAGFLGRAVVACLGRRGYHVRAISRSGSAIEGAAQAVASADLLAVDPARLVEGSDAVVNCAARVHVLRREEPIEAERAYRAMNSNFPLALGRAARHAGVQRFVQLSSAAAIASFSLPDETITDDTLPRPGSPYGRSKLAADEALAELASKEFVVVSLRPPAIYGPEAGAWFALFDRAARAGLPLPIGRIDNSRSFAFVDNVAAAVATAIADGPAGAFLVTDSRPLSTAALYRKLLALHGHGDRVLSVPQGVAWSVARLVLRSRADSFLGNAAFSGQRFAKVFNWVPPITLDESLAQTVSARRP